jgi:hypothetical protein
MENQVDFYIISSVSGNQTAVRFCYSVLKL